MCIKYLELRIKYPKFCLILAKFGFSQQILMRTRISNSMEICPVGSTLILFGRTDGRKNERTDATPVKERAFMAI